MFLNLRATQLAMHETRHDVFGVPRDEQRPINARIGTANLLFLCHARSQSHFKQMSAAEPPP